MADILHIATSALNAFQRGLEVTANNISNAGTPGYSRQTLVLKTLPSQFYAGNFIGTGVSAEEIRRVSDRFASQQVRETLTSKVQYETFYSQAMQIDKLLGQDGTNVSMGMRSFFNSLNQLNQAPENMAARNVVFNQAETMVSQFNDLQLKLDEYQHNNLLQLQEATKRMNQLTSDIAAINSKLRGLAGAPELLDHRDELLKELSKYTDVMVIDQGDNLISVSVGSGEVLVNGAFQRNLQVKQGLFGQSGTRIALDNDGVLIDVTDNLHGGMIGGLVDFEHHVLDQANNLLGQIALGLASNFNDQQNLGMDLNNLIGKDFFKDFNSANMQLERSVASTTNLGTGILSVNISDINQLRATSYELTVTNTGTNEVRVVRASDGQSQLLTWSSAPPTPPAGEIVIDGMTITVDDLGNLTNNDRYYINPTKGAAGKIDLNITDPRDIALASPVRTQANINNTGTGKINLGTVYDTTAVAKDFRIVFTSDTQYNLINDTDSVTTGPFTIVPGTDNIINIPNNLSPSYSVIISGIPKNGDEYSASYNTNGFGDNRNGLQLANIQSDKFLENGAESIADRYATLLAQIGSKANQAQLRGEAADILHEQAIAYKESKSGVVLEEEAANLLHFQLAYQAAGQLLSAANQMINTLIAAIR